MSILSQMPNRKNGLAGNIRDLWSPSGCSGSILNVHSKKNRFYRKGIDGGPRRAF